MAIVVGLAVVALPAAAFGAGGETGTILLKGPGSVYGGADGVATLTEAAGTAGSFGVEVKNTGSSTAQFNLALNTPFTSCASTCTATTSLAAGSLILTPLASGPNGYFTAPIAPGAIATYTLKIAENKAGSTPGDYVGVAINLNDTAGNNLASETVAVNDTRSTGTGGADQFASSTGTSATSGNPASFQGLVTAPTVAAGKNFTYTIKLVNDGPSPTRITYQLSDQVASNCIAYFPLKVTTGSSLSSTTVTAAVLGGTYQTPILAHGASVTLTVTGTSQSGGSACLGANGAGGSVEFFGTATDTANDQTGNALFFSPVPGS